MIPFAEWSRERASQPPILMAAEPRPLQPSPEPEEETQDLAELSEAVVLTIAENARIEQALLMRQAVASECGAMLGQLAETVKQAAHHEAKGVLSQLNGLLAPWIGQRIAEKAVTEFAEEVELAFGRKLGGELVCQVPGPLQPLLEAELARLGLKPTLEASGDCELRAIHGDTRIESTLSLWQEKLARLLS